MDMPTNIFEMEPPGAKMPSPFWYPHNSLTFRIISVSIKENTGATSNVYLKCI